MDFAPFGPRQLQNEWCKLCNRPWWCYGAGQTAEKPCILQKWDRSNKSWEARSTSSKFARPQSESTDLPPWRLKVHILQSWWRERNHANAIPNIQHLQTGPVSNEAKHLPHQHQRSRHRWKHLHINVFKMGKVCASHGIVLVLFIIKEFI